MSDPTAEQLTDAYRSLRHRVTAIGRGLDPETADAKTPTCPAWSTKDVLAHMTGVAADILDGNVEGAATEAWADAQVEKRRDASLTEVLDEWDALGPILEDVLGKIAAKMPYQFFIDAWTHEWDVRQAVSIAPVEPDLALVGHAIPALVDSIGGSIAAQGLSIELTIAGLPGGSITRSIGNAAGRSRTLTAFDFMRVTMGRRSIRQIRDLLDIEDLPDGDWAHAFVMWTPNDVDVIDPVVA